MKRTYKTAQGQLIDFDALKLINEDSIAVGNMRVNARGDALGPGGDVAKTRNELMSEYYQIEADPVDVIIDHQNQGIAIEDASTPRRSNKKTKAKAAKATENVSTVAESTNEFVQDEPNIAVDEGSVETVQEAKQLRGTLADSVAKGASVSQTLLKHPSKKNGVQRI